MVIDELIARLGFRVDGLDALKTALTRLREFVKSVLGSINPFKKAGAATSPLQSGLAKVSAAAVPATASMGRMAAVARVVAVGLAGVVAGAAAAAGGIILLAQAFAKAARARREFQIEAQGQGTTAKRFDLMRNALAAQAGVGEKKAEKTLSSLLDGVNDLRGKALAGDAEARASLAKYGLSARDRKGQPVDASALALSAASQFIDRNARADALRKRGKDKDATKLDVQNRQFGDLFGITGELAAILRTFPDVKALEASLKSAGERSPGPNSEQEERSARVSRGLAELEQKLGTVGQVFSNVATAFADALLPLANFIADKIIQPLKAVGAIPKTAAEQDADAKTAGNAAWEARRERGTRNVPEATAGQRRRDAAADEPARLEKLRQRSQAAESGKAGADPAMPKWMAKPPEWMTNFGAVLPDLAGMMKTLNQQALATLGKDREIIAKVDPGEVKARADIGVKTDVNVRVEPSSELIKAFANAKTMGQQMGAMIAKSANTATAGATAP
jgi:hypothetical protein